MSTMASKLIAFRDTWRRRGPVDALHASLRWMTITWRARNPDVRRHVVCFNDFFFAELGIDRSAAEAVYRAAAAKVGFAAGEGDSIHRLAFAALAASGFMPQTVLELGTSHGETTEFLAEIFPASQIFTIDLPDDDPLYRRMHPQGNVRNDNVARRLARPNITAIRKNTVFVQTLDLPKFDLIWVDAGHHFPEVAWDHFFCMDRLNPGGWLFTDDVMLPDNPLARKRPEILDVWRVIDYFNQRLDPGFRLLLKRESVRQYFVNVKYVGFFRQPADRT
jgi:predicted O-methyltransferase YrrM